MGNCFHFNVCENDPQCLRVLLGGWRSRREGEEQKRPRQEGRRWGWSRVAAVSLLLLIHQPVCLVLPDEQTRAKRSLWRPQPTPHPPTHAPASQPCPLRRPGSEDTGAWPSCWPFWKSSSLVLESQVANELVSLSVQFIKCPFFFPRQVDEQKS